MIKTCPPLGATTRDLIVAVQRRGSDAPAALEALLTANNRLISAVVSRLSPSDGDGILAQEARLAFINAVGAYDVARASSFSNYAWKTMAAAVRGLLAQSAEQHHLHWAGDGADADPTAVPEPAQPGLPFDERLAVLEAVGRLPDRDRRVIGGLYWQRESQEHVARSLGISQQAVAKRHRRALDQLHFALTA
jgi:RNA polymerase sigma factor (sigma-70 family)